jgi:hypothetical protein
MLRYLMLLIATVLIFSATHTANAQKKFRVEVKDVVVKEAKDNHIALEIFWGYIEQDNLRRPGEIMVIAVFVDSKGKERKSVVNIPVSSGGALPTSTRVVINHEEQIVSPRDIKFVVTVAPKITDGTSNIIADRKEVTLRVNPTR